MSLQLVLVVPPNVVGIQPARNGGESCVGLPGLNHNGTSPVTRRPDLQATARLQIQNTADRTSVTIEIWITAQMSSSRRAGRYRSVCEGDISDLRVRLELAHRTFEGEIKSL